LLIFFYIFSPKPIFIFLGITFIFLCFYVMDNFYEEINKIELLYEPEVKHIEDELKIISNETEKIVKKSKDLEEELFRLKEYFRIIDEINENLELNKLFSEFYRILKNKFEDDIQHLALIKSRKKDILEINIFPITEDKNSEIEIKNNYLNFLSRREFKNYISYTIFVNYYEYRMVVKCSENARKEKIVPQLNFLFEETRIGFERAILFKEVEELSRIDGLTGLYLRRYFIQRLENEFLRIKRYNEEFTILMFDIDFFKKINDIYGHLAGDKVLKEIADILKTNVANLGLISRWGGEEFLIFLPYHNITKSYEIAEKIRIYIEKNKFLYDNKEINVTISCGISNFPSDSDVLDKLIEISDNRLYKAKNSGRKKLIKFII
ncbi:MAG: GGDEF domain-containing protein, partial [Endomicrobiia bacterium]